MSKQERYSKTLNFFALSEKAPATASGEPVLLPLPNLRKQRSNLDKSSNAARETPVLLPLPKSKPLSKVKSSPRLQTASHTAWEGPILSRPRPPKLTKQADMASESPPAIPSKPESFNKIFGKKMQRSASPDSELRRMKTRLRKNETENTTMKERMQKLEKELKTARDELARGAMEGEFSRVLNLDDPKESKLYESEQKLKKQHAKEVYGLREEIDRLGTELHRLENMSSRDSRQMQDKLEDRLVMERRKHMQELESLRRECDDIRKAAGREKAHLHAQMSEEYKNDNHRWEAELLTARSQHQAELTEVVAKYERQMLPMQKQVEELKDRLSKTSDDKSIVNKMAKKYEGDLLEREHEMHRRADMHNAELGEVMHTHSAELNKVVQDFQRKLAVSREQTEILQENSNRELTEYKSSMAKSQRMHEEESTILGKDNASLKAQLDEAEAHRRNMLDDHAAVEAKYAEKLSATATEYEKKIEAILADQDEKIAASIKQQETDQKVRIAGWESKLQKVLENHAREVDHREQEHHNDLANSEKELETLKKQLAEHDGTEGHYKMRFTAERESRKSAVRKYQEEKEKRLLLEQQLATIRESEG